jgi:GNAT superfamily N-acetyltransferase
VPVVTVRDAQVGDAEAIAEVWAAAVPYLVRSPARAAADLSHDAVLHRRRWVGLVGDRVAGTAAVRAVEAAGGDHEVDLSVEVRPDLGSRGVGTALLRTAASAFPDATVLRATSTDDPISMAFAVRNGFLPEGEQQIAAVDTHVVGPAGPAPQGLRPISLDALPDLQMLFDAYHQVAADDSGLGRPSSLEDLRLAWWDSPDNAPELSWGLVSDEASGPVLAAFSTVSVDRQRHRAWNSMTATLPAYRRRGLASWAKRRALNALRSAGLTGAWTAEDSTNAAMLAVNRRLGFETVATSIRVARRLPH